MIISSYKNSFPSVSVAIPTYNEANHIAKVIQGFLHSKYPNLLEIIVADGGSTDGTQKIVINLSFEDARIKLIKNPLKIQAGGLNIALEKSQGDIFLRADAHAEYAPDYIERCVEVLQQSQALNVGGAQRFVATTPFQAGIALASKSFFGSGGAKYRNPNYNGFSDTVFLGCFWRKPLLKIAGYCSDSFANEDAELNLRLTTLKSPAIYISSQIKVWYFPRKTWKYLSIQYFQYGRGRYLTTTKHPYKLQLRGRLPFIGVSLLLLLVTYNFFIAYNIISCYQILSSLFILAFLESLRINYQYRAIFTKNIWRGNSASKPSFIKRCLYCSITLLTMPLAHFCGYSYQLLLTNWKRLQKILFKNSFLPKIKPNSPKSSAISDYR